MGKLGRKVRCKFNPKVMCIMLNAGRMCVFDETSGVQVERREMQLGFCPLLPEYKKEEFMSGFLKNTGCKVTRRWSD